MCDACRFCSAKDVCVFLGFALQEMCAGMSQASLRQFQRIQGKSQKKVRRRSGGPGHLQTASYRDLKGLVRVLVRSYYLVWSISLHYRVQVGYG